VDSFGRVELTFSAAGVGEAQAVPTVNMAMFPAGTALARLCPPCKSLMRRKLICPTSASRKRVSSPFAKNILLPFIGNL
jgi:hypothetical protein